MSRFPTLDLIAEVHENMLTITEFMEWYRLQDDAEMKPIEALMNEFFGIDEAEAEKERRQIIDEQNRLNEDGNK